MRAADNPFRSRKIQALEFEGTSPLDIFDAWIKAGMRGAIVGPQGSGKTTLFGELFLLAKARGLNPQLITFHEEESKVISDPEILPDEIFQSGSVVFVDGIDSQLKLFSRLKNVTGILVTCHQDLDIPILYRTRTTSQLLKSLLGKLVTHEFSENYLEDLLEVHRGNIREVFMGLYDAASSCES